MSAILFRLKFRPDLAVRVSGPDTHEQKSKKVEESGEGFQDFKGRRRWKPSFPSCYCEVQASMDLTI